MNDVIVVPIHSSFSSLGFNLRPLPPDRKCISACIVLQLGNKAPSTLESSSDVLEFPSNPYTDLSQHLIGCSDLSQHLIGC